MFHSWVDTQFIHKNSSAHIVNIQQWSPREGGGQTVPRCLQRGHLVQIASFCPRAAVAPSNLPPLKIVSMWCTLITLNSPTYINPSDHHHYYYISLYHPSFGLSSPFLLDPHPGLTLHFLLYFGKRPSWSVRMLLEQAVMNHEFFQVINTNSAWEPCRGRHSAGLRWNSHSWSANQLIHTHLFTSSQWIRVIGDPKDLCADGLFSLLLVFLYSGKRSLLTLHNSSWRFLPPDHQLFVNKF